MPMKKMIVAMLGLILASPVYAMCRCVPPGTAKNEFNQSAAVFSGRVVTIKKAPGMTERVTFQVLKRWKGPRKRQIVLINSTDPEACGMVFKKGQKYLVYALGESSKLRSSLCTRTAFLELSGDDIAEFK